MHRPLPTPLDSAAATRRTRVRWDNVAILLVGLVAATFAVTLILASGSKGPRTSSTPNSGKAPLTQPSSADNAAGEDLVSMDTARSLVEEARGFMTEARWDEAADRLASIPESLREVSGASSALTQLDELRGKDAALRAELTAAVEARQWRVAAQLLNQLAAIAPLDDALTATQTQVSAALAEPSTSTKPGSSASENDASASTSDSSTKQPKAAAGASSATGGGASTGTGTGGAAGSTGSSRPKPATPRPAAGAGSNAGATPPSGSSTTASGSPNGGISAAQQQELEDILEGALADSELTLQ